MSSETIDKDFHGVSIHITWTIDPKDRDTFMTELKELYAHVVKEEGCTFIEVFESVKELGVIRFIEHWNKPMDWLQEHQIGKDFYKKFMAAVDPMLLKPWQVEPFNRLGKSWWSVRSDN